MKKRKCKKKRVNKRKTKIIMGSVCNVPVNILGKIEEYVNSAFVVACDMDDDMPHTRALVGEER